MIVTKTDIINWTLEYACKYKYHNVISDISKKTSTNIKTLSVSNLYLVTSALHSIVSSEDFESYDQAVRYHQFLYENCSDFIPFRIFSKLSTGIKIVVLLKMLEHKQDGAVQKLDDLFPTSISGYKDVDKKELHRLSSVYNNFRKFYLPLTLDVSLCDSYLRDEYPEEYGPEFHSALTRLMETFISKIEEHFPVTVIEKFMKTSEDDCYELHLDSPSPAFEIFLDSVLGKSHLTEEDLKQLLAMLGTNTDLHRVHPLDHIGTLTSSDRSSDDKGQHHGSDSLFSSSSNKETPSSTNRHSSDEIFNSHQIYANDRTNNQKVQHKQCKFSTCVHNMEITNTMIQPADMQGITKDNDKVNNKRLQQVTVSSSTAKVQMIHKHSAKCHSRKSLRLRNKSMNNSTDISNNGIVCCDKSNVSTGANSSQINVEEKTLVSYKNLKNLSSDLNADKLSSKHDSAEVNSVSDNSEAEQLINTSTKENRVVSEHSHTEPGQVHCITSSNEKDSTTSEEFYITSQVDLNDIEILTQSSSNSKSNIFDDDIWSDDNDDIDFVPTSDLDEIELDDIYNLDLKSLSGTKTPLVPQIANHLKHPELKLCIVKLYRDKNLNVKEKGMLHQMYT